MGYLEGMNKSEILRNAYKSRMITGGKCKVGQWCWSGNFYCCPIEEVLKYRQKLNTLDETSFSFQPQILGRWSSTRNCGHAPAESQNKETRAFASAQFSADQEAQS